MMVLVVMMTRETAHIFLVGTGDVEHFAMCRIVPHSDRKSCPNANSASIRKLV